MIFVFFFVGFDMWNLQYYITKSYQRVLKGIFLVQTTIAHWRQFCGNLQKGV